MPRLWKCNSDCLLQEFPATQNAEAHLVIAKKVNLHKVWGKACAEVQVIQEGRLVGQYDGFIALSDVLRVIGHVTAL